MPGILGMTTHGGSLYGTGVMLTTPKGHRSCSAQRDSKSGVGEGQYLGLAEDPVLDAHNEILNIRQALGGCHRLDRGDVAKNIPGLSHPLQGFPVIVAKKAESLCSDTALLRVILLDIQGLEVF